MCRLPEDHRALTFFQSLSTSTAIPLSYPVIHLPPHHLDLLLPLVSFLLTALRAQPMFLPPHAFYPPQRLDGSAEPAVSERRIDDHGHPRLCKDVRAGHVRCGSDGEEDGRKVLDELVLEGRAEGGDRRGQGRVRRGFLKVRGGGDRVEQPFANLPPKGHSVETIYESIGEWCFRTEGMSQATHTLSASSAFAVSASPRAPTACGATSSSSCVRLKACIVGACKYLSAVTRTSAQTSGRVVAGLTTR